MKLTEPDIQNLKSVVKYAFEHGMVKSANDARVLLVLEQKLGTLIVEDENGDNVPDSSE